MPVWTQIESIEVEHAERMLREHGELAPSLYAFRFDELTFMADLRPFERFGMAGALDEVLPLVSATRSNRVVLGTTGRAWSLDDPVPPVTEGADLRQRVHITMFLDATTTPPRVWTAVRPFELGEGDLRWGEPFDPGEASGPVWRALRRACRTDRPSVPTSPEGLRTLLRRCLQAGHLLELGLAGAALLLPIDDPARRQALAAIDAAGR